MGVGTAGTIAARLIAAGRDAATPVAVVENATRPEEVRAFGVLGEVGEVIARAGIEGPGLLVIGEVVRLARDHTREAFRQPAQSEGGEAATKGSGREDWAPRSALRSARDDRSSPSLSDLWRMLS
jgi:hypothetical protein